MLIHHAATYLRGSAVRQLLTQTGRRLSPTLPVTVTGTSSLAIKLTLLPTRLASLASCFYFIFYFAPRRKAFLGDVYEQVMRDVCNRATASTRTLSRCFHSSAHSRSVRRWSITSSWRAPCTAGGHTHTHTHKHHSQSDALEHTVYTTLSAGSVSITSSKPEYCISFITSNDFIC